MTEFFHFVSNEFQYHLKLTNVKADGDQLIFLLQLYDFFSYSCMISINSAHLPIYLYICIIYLFILISDGFFEVSVKLSKCYCHTCHKHRGEEAYSTKGDPPRGYSRPLGWCKFGLRYLILFHFGYTCPSSATYSCKVKQTKNITF